MIISGQVFVTLKVLNNLLPFKTFWLQNCRKGTVDLYLDSDEYFLPKNVPEKS
jgi:hypothetical protein